MDCELRVIQGPDQGLTCQLAPGETVIGRGNTAQMKLTAPDVSYEHAIVTRNGEGYVLQNLSAQGTFIDDAKVTTPIRLRVNEKIRLTEQTVLRLEPVGAGSAGLLAHRGALWTIVILMLAVVVVLLVWNPFETPKRPDDWDSAFTQTSAWLAHEVQAKRAPVESVALFQQAWRLEQLKNYKLSYPMWLKLQLLLDSMEDKQRLVDRSARHPRALQNMLTPPPQAPEPDDEEKSAAFVQFVTRRLAWSIRQNELASKSKFGMK